jgi:hypothetical protein
MNELAQIASNLARNAGWPVFPVRNDKRPATRHGFKDATTDPAEIARLFALPGAALIGVPTGKMSGADVLDVDVKHDAARAWLLAVETSIPSTRSYRTRSGGVHL